MKPITALLLFLCVLSLIGCKPAEQKTSGNLQVIATLFPLYDFARIIAGDKADVRLLLPPGREPHTFEPRPDDIVRIASAGVFIYTSPYMEPWAETLIKGIDRRKVRVVNAGQGVKYARAVAGDEHDGHGENNNPQDAHPGGMDPHIWLDFGNDLIIVDNILTGFVDADPANAAYYKQNAANLKASLEDLDRRFRSGLSSCQTRVLVHGGHFAFGYLARRYNLQYRALSGVSSESEPSAVRMAEMVRLIKSSGVRYLYAEELLSPRLSETLAREAGIQVLRLHGAHNLSREDFDRGATFLGLMEQNLANLQKGLACRK